MSKRDESWLDVPFKAALLGVEAQTVIGLRLLRLSVGGAAAAAEAERMVTEKAWTALEVQAEFTRHALAGRPNRATHRSLDMVRRRVRANRRRLSQPM